MSVNPPLPSTLNFNEGNQQPFSKAVFAPPFLSRSNHEDLFCP
ncbi:hypothetical protein ACPOL_0972 [Acidisarcina polymorpha]|uniref:Uncharacterized protein n=1 Tax=Acidisarcina polymorpha TaxID=2211140 RepID=A0A2Z5FU11_9BACT|nr:hypothetical protein ACPOL_0972 [Acidisarcina polymorpha]